MPKRLAITISGAVSLGSFEAGVLYEVFQAIAAHNNSLSPGSNDRIVIDVMTGASAGGMTAAIAAQKAMFESSALSQPYNNSLYGPWVQDVSITGLLALKSDEDPSQSILSSDLIQSIAQKYLLGRYSTHLVPAKTPHPAVGSAMKLGLALSNLNGVDYSAVSPNGASFVYTQFKDQILFSPDNTSDTPAYWTPVMNAALACGAFPFAFRPRDIYRNRSEYIPPGLANDPNLLPFPSDPRLMTYTDGGLFQNEPLGMAKNLADEIDHHLDNDSRFYLFVSPHAKVSQGTDGFHAADANFLKFLGRMVSAVIDQSGFQDWANALELNKEIALFNTRADQLKKLIVNGGINALTLAPVNSALLNALFSGTPASARPNALARLATQFQSDCQDLDKFDNSGNAKSAWLDSVLTLEMAANLGAYDEMEVIGITATDAELASSALTAFMGFFDQRYRDHDYDVGRQKAQATLSNPALLGGLGPLQNYVPQPIRPLDSTLAGLTLKDADTQVVGKVRDRLEDDVKTLLSEAGVNSIELELAGPTIIKPALNALLGL